MGPLMVANTLIVLILLTYPVSVFTTKIISNEVHVKNSNAVNIVPRSSRAAPDSEECGWKKLLGREPCKTDADCCSGLTCDLTHFKCQPTTGANAISTATARPTTAAKTSATTPGNSEIIPKCRKRSDNCATDADCCQFDSSTLKLFLSCWLGFCTCSHPGIGNSVSGRWPRCCDGSILHSGKCPPVGQNHFCSAVETDLHTQFCSTGLSCVADTKEFQSQYQDFSPNIHSIPSFGRCQSTTGTTKNPTATTKRTTKSSTKAKKTSTKTTKLTILAATGTTKATKASVVTLQTTTQGKSETTPTCGKKKWDEPCASDADCCQFNSPELKLFHHCPHGSCGCRFPGSVCSGWRCCDGSDCPKSGKCPPVGRNHYCNTALKPNCAPGLVCVVDTREFQQQFNKPFVYSLAGGRCQ